MTGGPAFGVASLHPAGGGFGPVLGLQSPWPPGTLYLVAGVALLVVVVVDLLWTTLWVDGGAGPLSSRLTTWLWRAIRLVGDRRPRALSLAGPVILVATLVTWVGAIWAGWSLVFASSETALVDAQDPEPVSWIGRVYFVGYSMFTMGNGDFFPADGIWQIAASLTTASGMLFVTLAVSYVLSVLAAVSLKRSFAAGVTGLGTRSESFVRSGWDDDAGDFHQLDLPLDTLSTQLDTLAEQHRSYPILHYYHSERGEHASAIAVVVLDEAMTVFRYGVPEQHRPNDAILESGRASTESYLRTLNNAFIQPADRTPPPPDLDRLDETGVPTVADEEFSNALDALDERRRKLLGMVEADGWSWPPPEQ